MKITRKRNPLTPHIYRYTCPVTKTSWMAVYYPQGADIARLNDHQYRQSRLALAFARSLNFRDNTYANSIYKQEAKA